MSSFSSPLTKEMEHITQEMYKKNLDLAERNKTLSLLRKIEEIALSSVVDPKEVMKSVANAIVTDAEFKAVFIHEINHNKSALHPLAVAFSSTKDAHVDNLLGSLSESSISLIKGESLLAKAVHSRKAQSTKQIYFLPCPNVDLIQSREIQKKLGIDSFFVYPLITRDNVIGTLVVGVETGDRLSISESKSLLDRLPNIVSIALDNTILYQTIRKANERLKEVDKLKDDFVSIASHELRSPMTAIKGYLWLALNNKKTKLDSDLKEYLTIASVSTERLIKLVGNMLTISRIEGKRLELTIKEFKLQDLIKHVYDELAMQAKTQHIDFKVIVPKKNIIVSGDSDRLHEVIQNLVGNALKFTQEGGSITIQAKIIGKEVEVTVSDTGPGMSKEDQSKLFQKFGMMGNSYAKTKNASGTGLGLYITKQILALHKGHISVESELGKGSTFRFTLPL
jgi:signal transduction histidine kinase